MRTHFPEAMIAAAADRTACRDLLRGNSRSFYAASRLLPRAVREPATALYAFCRIADDAVDLQPSRTAVIARLRERLDRAYRGLPLPLSADRAFAETVTRFAVPRALPEALLEGLAWDAAGRRYETLDALHGYAARVAGSVGATMAVVMGVHDPAVIARACDLGVAMQLTNIARDVGEDARRGRLYLPEDWMRAEGIDPDAWLAAPRFTPALGRVVARLLAEAETLYARGETGIAALPAACRPGIRAARLIYAAIGTTIASQDCDTLAVRAVVPGRVKAALLARAVMPSFARRPVDRFEPPLPACRFLVDAVGPKGRAALLARGLGDRMVWVIDLLQRIEGRRQAVDGGLYGGRGQWRIGRR